ncbi:PKD domain-containing protein [Candidatus Sumerlaeota bacterium]|nr:PKD domain-containing protein [Candidatus Sumerlaeota bacterium]
MIITSHGKGVPLLAALALAACPLAGAQSITQVTPPVIDVASQATFTIHGTGLESYDGFAIRKNGGSQLPLDIVSQTSTTVQCAINLAPHKVGLYHVHATGPSLPPLLLANAFEVTRPSTLQLTRPTLGGGNFPFTTAFDYMNTQVIILQSDIGRAGEIFALRFYSQPGAPDPTGTITVRLKHTPLATFSNDSLDNTGWLVCAVTTNTQWAPDDTLLIPFDTTFPYDGTQNLMISVLNDASSTGFGNWTQTFECGSNRLVAGSSNLNTPPSSDWTGSTPAARVLRSQIPRMELTFSNDVVAADFSTGSQSATENELLAFTNDSVVSGPSMTTWSWDFDGDGIADSTQPSPTHAWPSAGTYTVELTASKGYTEDAETKVDYITVSPGSSVEWTLVEME